MARYARHSLRRRRLYSTKRRYRTRYTFRRRKSTFRRRPRGMQRIKRVRWPVKNIGGDRAYTKLRYVIGESFSIATGNASLTVVQAMNVGAAPPATALQAASLSALMGQTPNLSTMGALYLNYRIRGIKIKLTYWQTAGEPVCLFTNAASSKSLTSASAGPSPPFVTPVVSVTPEQRWAKYRVCQATANGGRATSLSSYYSVNKVYGPDKTVKNDKDFTGEMGPALPYWSQDSTPGAQPVESPWLQYGLFTLSGNNVTAPVTGVLKVEQTVYCEFFGKRISTQ